MYSIEIAFNDGRSERHTFNRFAELDDILARIPSLYEVRVVALAANKEAVEACGSDHGGARLGIGCR
jgi:hypothetical protein